METKPITIEEAQKIWKEFSNQMREVALPFHKHEWKVFAGIPHIISADGSHVFHISPNSVTPGYVH